jgi:hypothetical protein
MDEATLQTPGPNSARFHFDPGHDPSAVPSMAAIEAWARRRMRREGSHLAMGYGTMVRSPMLRHGLRDRLTWGIPLLRRRMLRRIEERCVEAIMRELAPVHETMREFAVDLTVHATLADKFEAIATIAAMSPHEHDSRRFVEKHRSEDLPGLEDLSRLLDQMDSELRIAEYHAGIRAALETEALLNIVLPGGIEPSRASRIRALRASLDEVRQIDMRETVLRVLEQVER